MKWLLMAHLLGSTVWVGGMFFAFMALRPASVELLETPERLILWNGVLRRFLSWVWVAVLLILASGLGMIMMLGGFAKVAWPIHLMFALGVIMMLIFGHIYFAGYARLKRYVSGREWPAAGKALIQVRMLVGMNLILGLLTIVIATLGSMHH
jgi:uncharacterized membrane protein